MLRQIPPLSADVVFTYSFHSEVVEIYVALYSETVEMSAFFHRFFPQILARNHRICSFHSDKYVVFIRKLILNM